MWFINIFSINSVVPSLPCISEFLNPARHLLSFYEFRRPYTEPVESPSRPHTVGSNQMDPIYPRPPGFSSVPFSHLHLRMHFVSSHACYMSRSSQLISVTDFCKFKRTEYRFRVPLFMSADRNWRFAVRDCCCYVFRLSLCVFKTVPRSIESWAIYHDRSALFRKWHLSAVCLK